MICVSNLGVLFFHVGFESESNDVFDEGAALLSAAYSFDFSEKLGVYC